MKKASMLIVCLLFTVVTAQAHDLEKYNDRQIEELSQRAFRYSNNNGKPSLTLITGYTGDIWSQKWYLDGYGKPCDNNVAKLNKPGAAVSIPGTSLILAFLECPACNDSGVDSIIAFFDRKNTRVPLCFQHIHLMDIVRSMEIRKSGGKGYYVVTKSANGDGMYYFNGLTFLFINNTCKVTTLSTLFECVNEEDNGVKCSNKVIDCRFINDHIVDVITKESHIKNFVEVSRKQYDLKLLYENPKSRTFFKP